MKKSLVTFGLLLLAVRADGQVLIFGYDDSDPTPPEQQSQALQDLILLHDHNTESPGSPSPAVSGVWSVSTDEYGTPQTFMDWEILAASGNNPIYTGENYWHTYLEQNDGNAWRTERSGSVESFQRTDMISAGSGNWYAPEKLWYGFVFRCDRMDQWGVIDFPSPKGGGIVIQWHGRNFDVDPDWDITTDRNPPVSIVTQIGGFYVRLEDNDDNGGSTYFSSAILDDTVCGTSAGSYLDGEIHAIVLEIFWDTRTNAEGSQGVLNVYLDGNSTPVFSWIDKQNLMPQSPQPWLDARSTPRMPYFKWGGYRRDFENFTISIPNGTAQEYSWGHFVIHGDGANLAGVMESLDWDNRVQ